MKVVATYFHSLIIISLMGPGVLESFEPSRITNVFHEKKVRKVIYIGLSQRHGNLKIMRKKQTLKETN